MKSGAGDGAGGAAHVDDRLQVAGPRSDAAHVADDRLDDDGRDLGAALLERVAQAVELDHNDRMVSDAQWNLITRLVHTAEIPEARKEAIEKESNDYTSLEAGRCIEYLMENQPPANGFQHAVNELNALK